MTFALEELSDRVRDHFAAKPGFSERTMFGCHAFLHWGNMVVAATGEGALLARVGKDGYEAALALPGCGPMAMGGRTMSGFVVVDDDALADWLDRCFAFTATLPPRERSPV